MAYPFKMLVKLTLPFPNPMLSPNKRLHWAEKIKIKNEEKNLAYVLGSSYRELFGKSFIHLKIIFHAETKRSYDLDNALAASKAALDGLAQGLGVNDKQFRPITINYGEPDKLNPRMEIELECNNDSL